MVPPLKQGHKPVPGFGGLGGHLHLLRAQREHHGKFGNTIGGFRIALEKSADDSVRFDIDRLLRTVHETAEKSENRHVFFVCHSRV